ncbi:MAG: glutamate 5-kinase [Pseudomonadota bacterium]
MSHPQNLNHLVVKIGTSLLVTPDGMLRAAWLTSLAQDVAALSAQGVKLSIVTSGAVALGNGLLPRKTDRVEDKQAAAALGQAPLIAAYQAAFSQASLTVGQVLLTLADTQQRRAHLNARATLGALMAIGAVPIINENDTVTTQEIRYGDNDRLAAMVTQIIPADALIILSDVDGLYTSDPNGPNPGQHLPKVRALTPEISAMAAPPRPGFSRGGMATKLLAAQICLDAGCHMVIKDGRKERPLRPFIEKTPERMTWFISQTTPKNARKRWLAGLIELAGTLVVDAGASRALSEGKSLLPAGLIRAEGPFDRGDCVEIKDPDGHVLGRGLAAYSHEEMTRLAGHHSRDVPSILGYRRQEELIHRDDLILTPRQKTP